MITHEEIAEILNREVRLGEARLSSARWVLDMIIAEVPAISPPPDGQYRLTKAIQEHIAARQALEAALERNKAFTLWGIVPDDLK